VAGKDIEYVLKVSEIKEKKVPELNDELAKTIGDYADLDDLKSKVRRELTDAKEKANRSAAAADVLKEIDKRLNLELPETIVEEETLRTLRRALNAYPRQDIAPEALEQLKSRARQQAVERITNHLVLEKIAAREGIEVSEAEIDEEIRDIAKANNAPLASVVDAVNREGRRDEFRDAILFRKTVDFLVKNAIMS
jgi:trigger factor